MGDKVTAYEFACKINTEAIALLNSIGNMASLTFCSGGDLFEAQEKLSNLEEYEKEHRTLAMAYIVEYDGKNIYELLVENFVPERLARLHLIDVKAVQTARNFKRKMLRISERVKRFDAAL